MDALSMHFLILSLTRVTRFREVNNSITGRAWQTSNGSICLFVIRVIDDDQHGTMERHENLAGRTWQTDKFQPFANSTFSPPGFSTKLPNFWRVHPPQVHPASTSLIVTMRDYGLRFNLVYSFFFRLAEGERNWISESSGSSKFFFPFISRMTNVYSSAFDE